MKRPQCRVLFPQAARSAEEASVEAVHPLADGQPALWLVRFPDGAFAWMAGLARSNRMFVVGTSLEVNPGARPFNTAALYHRGKDLEAGSLGQVE